MVQLYMKPAGDNLILRQLIKFQRVHIQPGQSEFVTFEINRYDKKDRIQRENEVN